MVKYVKRGNAPELSEGDNNLVETYIAMLESPPGSAMPQIEIPDRIREYVRDNYQVAQGGLGTGRGMIDFWRKEREAMKEKPLVTKDKEHEFNKYKPPMTGKPEFTGQENPRSVWAHAKKTDDTLTKPLSIGQQRRPVSQPVSHAITTPPYDKMPELGDALSLDYASQRDARENQLATRGLLNPSSPAYEKTPSQLREKVSENRANALANIARARVKK